MMLSDLGSCSRTELLVDRQIILKILAIFFSWYFEKEDLYGRISLGIADISIPHYTTITLILSIAMVQRRTQEENKNKSVLDVAQEYWMYCSNFFTVLPENTITVKVVSALSLETQFWFITLAGKDLLLAEIQHKVSGQGKHFKHFLEGGLKQVLLFQCYTEDFLRF